MRKLAVLGGGGSSALDSGRAWTVAFAGALVNTWTFGVFYSFGAAFEQMANEFDSGLGATAAVFAITTFLFFSGGIVAGPLGDRFGPRPLLAFGALSMGFGLILTAEVQSLSVGYITYGLGVGAGIAAYLVPMTACVGGWFVRHRSLALGVYTGGIGIGTLVLVPASEWLIRTEGWRSAFRTLGFVSIVVYGLAAIIVVRPPGSAGASKRPFRAIVALDHFGRLYLSGFLMSVALFVPFVFIVKYSTDRGVSGPAAAALISVLGVGSVAGRFGLGALGTRFSVFTLVFLAYAVQPFAYVAWLVSDGNYPLLVFFSALLGAAYGGYVALSPVMAAELYGLEGLGSVLGVQYTSAGVGGLIGPIAAGVLLDTTKSFTIVILVAIGLTIAASIVFYPVQNAERRVVVAPTN